jgi:hypothetical protein
MSSDEIAIAIDGKNILEEENRIKHETINTSNAVKETNSHSNENTTQYPVPNSFTSHPMFSNMDQGKLFEQFLLFQNFMNNVNPPQPVNDSIKTNNLQNINPINNPINKQTKVEQNIIKIDQTVNEPIAIPVIKTDIQTDYNISKNNNIEPKIEPALMSTNTNSNTNINSTQNPLSISIQPTIKTHDIKSLRRNNSSKSIKGGQDLSIKQSENTTAINSKSNYNFDDVPIKPSGINFMELLEKNLANIKDGTEDGDNFNTEHHENLKKKKNKPRYKKVINISKPSKETKKYKYYSDNFQEGKAHVEENDMRKSSQGGQGALPLKENKTGKQDQHRKKSNHSPDRESNIENNRNSKGNFKPKKPDALAAK